MLLSEVKFDEDGGPYYDLMSNSTNSIYSVPATGAQKTSVPLYVHESSQKRASIIAVENILISLCGHAYYRSVRKKVKRRWW